MRWVDWGWEDCKNVKGRQGTQGRQADTQTHTRTYWHPAHPPGVSKCYLWLHQVGTGSNIRSLSGMSGPQSVGELEAVNLQSARKYS